MIFGDAVVVADLEDLDPIIDHTGSLPIDRWLFVILQPCIERLPASRVIFGVAE